MQINIEIYFENNVFQIYALDDCGGSGIKLSATTPQDLAEALSPYIADYADRCALAIDNGDGRVGILLSDRSRVYCRESLDIMDMGVDMSSVVVTEQDGTEICTVEGMTLPDIDDIDEDYVKTLEERIDSICD